MQYLNGKPGYVGILHTWGQNLGAHIHIHFIVAGGALSHRHDQWIRPPYEAKFLFPVLQMSKVFRGIFIKKIKRIYKKADLSFPEDLDYLSNPELFEQFLDQAVSRRWHVYAKAPFGGPLHMIKYLSSYVHRIAISNFRLKQINNGQITFTYKDYKDHCKIKSLTLSADEFIRRFLLHILPPKFKKIRFFGFMANHLRRKYCQLLRSLLGDNENNPKSLENNRDSHKNSCPICKKGLLVFKVLLKPWEIDDTMICWDTS
jgi:hypothetical protein